FSMATTLPRTTVPSAASLSTKESSSIDSKSSLVTVCCAKLFLRCAGVLRVADPIENSGPLRQKCQSRRTEHRFSNRTICLVGFRANALDDGRDQKPQGGN